eukprot:scaffold24887_cov113-Cylindrotheca_fusiformis.AAC.1
MERLRAATGHSRVSSISALTTERVQELIGRLKKFADAQPVVDLPPFQKLIWARLDWIMIVMIMIHPILEGEGEQADSAEHDPLGISRSCRTIWSSIGCIGASTADKQQQQKQLESFEPSKHADKAWTLCDKNINNGIDSGGGMQFYLNIQQQSTRTTTDRLLKLKLVLELSSIVVIPFENCYLKLNIPRRLHSTCLRCGSTIIIPTTTKSNNHNNATSLDEEY